MEAVEIIQGIKGSWMYKNIFNILITGVCFIIINGGCSSPQDGDEHSDPSGIYFGQEPPGTVPKIFNPLTASSNVLEGSYNFNYSGTECLFTRSGGQYTQGSIMYTYLDNELWQEPVIASFSVNHDDYGPGLSPDGSKVFFQSYRNLPDGTPSVLGIWYSEKPGNTWSDAIYAGIDGMYPSITDDGSIYATNWHNGVPCIVRSELLAGVYQTPVVVPSPVYSNTYSDAHPFIAADESYLIFDSDDRPRTNDCGLFISLKNNDGIWTEPQNMGTKISQNAAMPRVTSDGEYLFFGDMQGDTYWVSAAIIDDFRTN
jgi:Tol biopolymer transport system component